jgi:hypothetical protein
MSDITDWTTWLLAGAVVLVFALYFWFTGRHMFDAARRLIHTIRHWPEIRRSMVEAEVRAGGRYPLWYRLVRVSLIAGLIGLLAFVVWRKFAT